MKQWALKSVVESLKYDNVTYSDCHDNFIKWVESNFKNKIDVVDIGGGNGRVLIKLKPYVNNYYSLDLNSENIKIGKQYFSDFENAHFIEFDIDNDNLDIDCNVVYIDSVLTMIVDPFNALLKFKKVSDYTFVNRTTFGENTIKDKYKWDGMSEASTLWKFDVSTLSNFCSDNNMDIVILSPNSFYIKNNII